MRKILVAEDERNLREGIAEAFRDAKHEVVEAPDGEEALKVLQEQVFEIRGEKRSPRIGVVVVVDLDVP